MSDQDNFLSRWSRRKHDAAEAEAEVPSPPQPAVAEPSAPPEPAAAPAQSLFDLEALPAIETITAQTDIRAFLLPGVPAELRLAALRRAWTADPAIRDFIGLSENSWDFNDPAAMGGFGPLQMTDELRRVVAQLFTPAPEEPRPDGPDPGRHEQNSAPQSAVKTVDNVESPVLAQEERGETKEHLPGRGQLPQAEASIAAMQQPEGEHAAVTPTGPRCHGGALPK